MNHGDPAQNEQIVSRSCNVRRIDQQIGLDWYIEDEFLDSGVSNDSSWYPQWLKGLATKLIYHDKQNVIVKWQPTATESIGNCTQRTLSLTGKGGIGYSHTATICPDTYSPFLADLCKDEFGSYWSGNARYHKARETHGMTLVHSPPAATSIATTLWAQLKWGPCNSLC